MPSIPLVFENVAVRSGLIYTRDSIHVANQFRSARILPAGSPDQFQALVILADTDPLLIFEGSEGEARSAINDFVALLRREGRLFRK
jgi:hypothetical protein